MKHEMAARFQMRNGYPRRYCVCGFEWWEYRGGSCHSQMRHDDKGYVMFDTTAKMTEKQFEQRFREWMKELWGNTDLADAVIDCAYGVEGGQCFWEIMYPYAREMFGTAVNGVIGL